LEAVFVSEKLVNTFYMTLCLLNKYIAEWLATFKRKILRRMFGGIKVNENWRKQNNN